MLKNPRQAERSRGFFRQHFTLNLLITIYTLNLFIIIYTWKLPTCRSWVKSCRSSVATSPCPWQLAWARCISQLFHAATPGTFHGLKTPREAFSAGFSKKTKPGPQKGHTVELIASWQDTCTRAQVGRRTCALG